MTRTDITPGAGKRMTADELRAAKEAGDWKALGEAATWLAKAHIARLRAGGMRRERVTHDLVHDAVLAALEACRSWDPDKGAFRSWVTWKAGYAVAEHIQALLSGMVGSRNVHGTTGPYDYDMASPAEQPAQIAQRELDAHRLLSWLGDFEETQAVRLRYGFDGEPHSITEVAKKLGKSERTTYRLFDDIEKKLARRLAWVRPRTPVTDELKGSRSESARNRHAK
jgi:RNA polymerase sigma factor (sigma-70 family)